MALCKNRAVFGTSKATRSKNYKKGMSVFMKGVFGIDGPVVAFLSRVMDVMILSFLWAVCCLPIVTIGPSTSALYYVTMNMAKNTDNGIVKSFFRSFKTNMKQGVIITFLFLSVAAVLCFDYSVASSIEGVIGTVLGIVFVILTVCVLCTMFYTFPLLAKFENTIAKTLKNAFWLALQRLPLTALLFLIHSVPILLFFFLPEAVLAIFPVWLLLAPGAVAYFCSRLLTKLFDILLQPTQDETNP